MPYRCEACGEVIERHKCDYVVFVGGSHEASPELLYHTCCARVLLEDQPDGKCCVKHWDGQ